MLPLTSFGEARGTHAIKQCVALRSALWPPANLGTDATAGVVINPEVHPVENMRIK